MYKVTDTSLEEIFKSNSLRNMESGRNSPMPHAGDTFYVTTRTYNAMTKDQNNLFDLLEHGNRWSFNNGGTSISSYIDIIFKTVPNRLIQYGPNSTSSSYSVEFIFFGDDKDDPTKRPELLINAQGWGSSVIRIYEGDVKPVLEYFLKNQERTT